MADIDEDIEQVEEDYGEEEEQEEEEEPEEEDEPEEVDIEENEIIESDDDSQIVEENSESDEESDKNIKNNYIYDNEEKESEISSDDDSSSSDEELDDKFNIYDKKEYIKTYHTQEIKDTYNDINVLSIVQRDEDNNIIDDNHKTIPILTKYEKTKIIGLRVKQLNSNSKPYIQIDENILDNYIIATMELKEKKLPFIIQRPIQNRFEYWNIKDLEII